MRRAVQQQKEPWLVSVSYQRDAAEELNVAQDARRRFARPLGETFTYQSIIFLMIVLVVLVVMIEMTRRMSPFFPDENNILLYHAQFWAAFLPLLLLVQVAVIGYAWMIGRKRKALLRERIRAKGWTDFEVTTAGLKIGRDGEDIELDWRTVRNVTNTKTMILFDLDQTVFFIPVRAFKDKMEFLKQYKVIRQAWHNRLMDEVASQDLEGGQTPT